MSHFTTIVIVETETEDIEARVAALLAPFDENMEVQPHRNSIQGDELEHMAKFYKTNDLDALSNHIKAWNRCEGGVDGGQLYYLSTYNPESRWDWYRIGGRWDGDIENNQALISKTFESEAFAVVLPTGMWHQRGQMGWFGISHDEMPDGGWEVKRRQLYDEYHGYLAVVVDCHI